jgi:2-oxoglutarate dehydrogenase E2 component (dihydrolipoamide succinyltransferase)
MPITVTMPQMGESVVEGTVERWCIAEGERVEKDQTLCEITTDKVDAEIPAPEAGVVTRILVAPGTTVEVGAELCELDPAGTAAKAGAEKVARAAEPRERAAAAPEAPAAREAPGAAEAPAAEAAPEAPAPGAPRRRASPLARRMAEAHGVDLERVDAGEAGRVTAEQVKAHARAAAARGAPEAAAAPPPGSVADWLARYRVPQYRPREGDRVTPFSTIRKRIAEHMVVSKIVSPHVGTVTEVDFHNVVALRQRVRGEFEQTHGIRLSYLPFVVQATVRALREYPQLNVSVVDETIVERPGIHIGVAVETERGLLVPVIRDADRLSLVGIAQALQDLAERARSRQITADELQGGTFTVTNPGREGNLYGFAVINQPQVGILRTGELKKRPVVIERDGEESIAIRPMMYLALSYDHRVIDGVTGTGFLYRVAKLLEAGEFEI